MTDIAPILNDLLKSYQAPPTALSVRRLDEFLKEAYRINAHIASLNVYLKSIRQSYLSTAPPPRRTHNIVLGGNKQWKYLTVRQREEIDAETKQLIRELNASIRNLADAEKLRQQTEKSLLRNKYSRVSLGLLGSWAAGGAGHTESYEEELEKVKAGTISMHRESVLWYLGEKLKECGQFQASMMEKRINREMEKNRSVLANSRADPSSKFAGGTGPSIDYPASTAHLEVPVFKPEEELTPEQIEIFEKENQDMIKHYESTLDQVRTAEKSLVEISELQMQLVNNLSVQSENINHLVADSFLTTENIGDGNKQLKKAAERKSTAKYVFYASCGLSLFLVVWDLVI